MPRWSKQIAEFLSTTQLDESLENLKSQVNFLEACSRFQLISGRLYYHMDGRILCLVPNPADYPTIVQETHVSFTGQHRSKQTSISRILCNGYWWPTMQFHVATFVAKVCKECQIHPLYLHAALYKATPILGWATKIVACIKSGKVEKDIPLHRKRKIEIVSKDYTLVGDQLYKKGIDGQLLLCEGDAKYIPILHQAHSGVGSGHVKGFLGTSS